MKRRLLAVLCWGISGVLWAAGLPDTVDRVKGAVVLVGTYSATDSPRFQFRGTGFAVGNGLQVITNAHVFSMENTVRTQGDWVVQVRTGPAQWQMRSATVVRQDPVHDLALLRIEGVPVPVLQVGDSGLVREGQELAFMGFPIGGVLGFSAVTHRALVSSITAAALPSPTSQNLTERSIRSLRGGGGAFEIFQLDATAYPGNSGGPLFDPQSGEVVGVVNMVLLKGTRESALSQPSGISYAIPSRYVRNLLLEPQN